MNTIQLLFLVSFAWVLNACSSVVSYILRKGIKGITGSSNAQSGALLGDSGSIIARSFQDPCQLFAGKSLGCGLYKMWIRRKQIGKSGEEYLHEIDDIIR